MAARSRPLVIVNINVSPRALEGCRAIAETLAELAPGLRIHIVHWREVLAGAVRRLRPVAVVLGPNDTPFPAYPPEFDALLAWVRARRGPTLGICGGHQALALAHGAPVGPVHAVPAATESYAGMPKVQGEVTIRLLGEQDPLFAGLPDEIQVAASHVDEVKEVPPDFRLLALGDPCNIQWIRADRRPMVGLQFHPERPATGGAGRTILANWLRQLGLIAS
ncbi:MAG: gamma-glutamyl-gamma-aminobutyrate hydrolase family protein [Deltaproteobacteria bacterium]|nr:gamma-glutamyl-gamma-aminobutyrate hydrolase family protein [Deltaproteobacteria bacterium]MCB9786391.1 gamma-glutamyl-gamma-aminobutyrate hydrolase family protein [Deltaproteobacteria bacterium]